MPQVPILSRQTHKTDKMPRVLHVKDAIPHRLWYSASTCFTVLTRSVQALEIILLLMS